jgi:uncharacterized small protein (DUF1192 family)
MSAARSPSQAERLAVLEQKVTRIEAELVRISAQIRDRSPTRTRC